VADRKKPRPPTKRQWEIAKEFKGGASISQIWYNSRCCPDNWTDVEQAIRAVMVWEGRDE